jgi:hypothetical protein
MEDIHGINPPIHVGVDPMILKIALIVLGMAALLIVLFLLIKKLWKKKQKPENLKYLPEPLPAIEIALKQLDLLIQHGMIDLRLFYFDLSAVLRNYIGRSFNINAIEMTSEQFIRTINILDFDREIKQGISKFQILSDSFKYAGIVPENDQADMDFLFIKKIILKIEKGVKQKEEKRKQELENRQVNKQTDKLKLGEQY